MTHKSVGKIVREATVLATERMQELGMPPLPHVTPHSFRRTYVSILLLASEFDLEWVMKQVGHADSKMTLEVYNQLQQRVKREHGASFDRLIREARERLHGSQEPPPAVSTPNTSGVCAEVCVESAETPPKPRPPRRPGRGQNLAISRKSGGNSGATRYPGINVFSRMLYQLSYLAGIHNRSVSTTLWLSARPDEQPQPARPCRAF